MTKIVIVASKNPCKMEACKLAITSVFPNDDFEFVPQSSKSGVSDQPIGQDETRQGAMNRVLDALATWKKSNSVEPEFVIGLEGGVERAYMPIDENTSRSGMSLIAWMAVYRPSDNRWGFGQTGSFYLPPIIVEKVESGIELGVADDQVFGRVNSGQASGTVGILTNNLITRSQYYQHALILALIPFLHPHLY